VNKDFHYDSDWALIKCRVTDLLLCAASLLVFSLIELLQCCGESRLSVSCVLVGLPKLISVQTVTFQHNDLLFCHDTTTSVTSSGRSLFRCLRHIM